MSDAPEQRGAHAPGGVAAAREALLAWVDEAGAKGRVFLQTRLLASRQDRYEIRHLHDVQRPPAGLQISSDPFAARTIAQTTRGGEHRPLKTAPNLRKGWVLTGLDARGLWTALDYLYPACAVHWHAGQTGTLRVTHWRETAGRQSGIYSAVRKLADEALRNTVRACCADAVCLRRVAWGIDADTALGVAPEGAQEGARVPCPEACSLFISFARKTLTLERAPRQEAPGLGTLSAEEIRQIQDIVAGAAASTLGAIREGEFDERLNTRRVRYLAARMAEARTEPEAAGQELPCEGCPRATPCAGCPVAA